MSEIRFRNTVHRDFFLENMMKCKVNDCYHRAFFLCDGDCGGNKEKYQFHVRLQDGLHQARGDARRMADKRHGQGLPPCFQPLERLCRGGA